tara:strand:- start:1264 stop:1545 length:282 start_codon:yes stop_codon:yes gene_type:complete
MVRKKIVDGVEREFTAAENAERDEMDKVRIAEAPAREMGWIRDHRNRLLVETDWMANSDVTMSDEWKTYRQELRDIPASNTVYEDVTWPPKPE